MRMTAATSHSPAVIPHYEPQRSPTRAINHALPVSSRTVLLPKMSDLGINATLVLTNRKAGSNHDRNPKSSSSA